MDKLEQLTQKLYEEGLSKGKAEGQAIVEKARSEAADMLKQAEDEAQKIIAQAEKEAADLRTKVEGDVKRAATQAIQATRSDIEQLIIAQAVDAPVKAALSSEAFLKEIITEVAKRFSAQESADISAIPWSSILTGTRRNICRPTTAARGSGFRRAAGTTRKLSGKAFRPASPRRSPAG